MKILLVKPALNPVFLAPMWGDPLELEYVAAAVPDHSVEILDMRIDPNLQAKAGEVQAASGRCNGKYLRRPHGQGSAPTGQAV